MYLTKKLLKRFIPLFFIPFITLSILRADDSLSINLARNKQGSSGAVLVTLTNNSDKLIKILKWNTPLESTLSADIFSIKNGKHTISYKGRYIKRGHPQDEDYTIFEAGESRTITVNLPTYYKMLKRGDYKISYRGNFNSLSENKKLKNLKKSKKSTTQLILPFYPTKIENEKKQKISSTFNGCSQSRVDILNETYDEALNMVKISSTAMNNASVNTTANRYVTWFGRATTERQKEVTLHFSNIHNTLKDKKISYDCGTCREDNVFGYVYPDEPYYIYLCGSFWQADLTGTDSKAGTLIHELTHFLVIAGTDDHVYGQEDAKELARLTPDKAINNADNHEFFAENTPYLSMDEEGNIFEEAKRVTSFPISDTIDNPYERKVYKFIPNKTGDYTFYTTRNLDTVGKLFDSQKNLITQNDDISERNENFELTSKLIENRVYYITVQAYQKLTGDYTLNQIYKENKPLDEPNNNTNNNNNNTNSGSSDDVFNNSSSNSVSSLNYLGVLLVILLTLFIGRRELS